MDDHAGFSDAPPCKDPSSISTVEASDQNTMSSSSAPSLGRLKGKVAIITGGASPQGFGYAIARRFIDEGAKVIIGDLDGSGAESSASSLSSDNAKGVSMDVCKHEDWKRVVEMAVEGFGRLDIVVNNAGCTYRNKPTAEVTEDEFERVMSVNVKSIFWSVKVVVPQMQKQGQGGSIINISSSGSVRPRPGLVWYNASKGAVSNATMALAAEYGPDQIRVNAIAPLLSATGLFESFVGVKDTQENRNKFAASIPLGRLTDPVDVGNACVFLASDEGKFVTGTNFSVDGGRHI
ncbi:NAD(P)-binding protein [Aureobasidium sp. EXF-10727]|nr:NAD(P)-binding protein [Aureobasidium sp. EXF-10727]KAI4731252.1 NAD(P)-binding protein [Aureobasidium sp. EXF-10728]